MSITLIAPMHAAQRPYAAENSRDAAHQEVHHKVLLHLAALGLGILAAHCGCLEGRAAQGASAEGRRRAEGLCEGKAPV